MPPRRARPVDPSLLPDPSYEQQAQHQQQQQYGAHTAYGGGVQQQNQGGYEQLQAGVDVYGGQQQQHGYSNQPQYSQQQQQGYGQQSAPYDSTSYQQPQQHQYSDPQDQFQQQRHQAYYQQHEAAPPVAGQGIPAPPHSAGRKLPGMRNKLDADQVPSPVLVLEADAYSFGVADGQGLDTEEHDGAGLYYSGENMGVPPLSGTEAVKEIDQGNSIPILMRSTHYIIPASNDIVTSSHIPLGLHISPFAPSPTQIPLVDLGPDGPPRCGRCRGYINPWVRWGRGGGEWECNLCGHGNPVESEYFSNLDHTGRRMDILERPELLYGTVDFRVPTPYHALQPNASLTYAPPPTSSTTAGIDLSSLNISGNEKQNAAAKKAEEKRNQEELRMPAPMCTLFVLDVSWNAAKIGLIKEFCESVRRTLFKDENVSEDGSVVVVDEAGNETLNEDGSPKRSGGSRLPKGSRVGFITFDRTVHFYDLSSQSDQPRMLIMSDIDDVFAPIGSGEGAGFLVDPSESRTIIEKLLDSLPNLFADAQAPDAVLGAALQASLESLKYLGGQVNIFQTSLPVTGPGALKHRDETKLYNTPQEKTLFLPQEPFWRNLAEDLVTAGVGVNLFLFPSQSIDVGTLGVIPGMTGGDLFYLPKFDVVRHGERLRGMIEYVVQGRETVYNGTMRVRCSTGLRVQEHFGSFYQRNNTDLEFGVLTSSQCISVALKHESKLDDRGLACFQAAVLYTTREGDRRVRCLNLRLPVTAMIANVFKGADVDSVVTLLTKDALMRTSSEKLSVVSQSFTRKSARLLLSYRRNCALGSPQGQLILPENFKLLPLYCLAIMKTKAFKGGNVIADVRTTYMRFLKSMTVPKLMAFLYPRMIAIHTMEDDHGFAYGNTGRLRMPKNMRLSYSFMEGNGAYLLVNGEVAMLWLGASVSPQILEDLYGVDDLAVLDSRMAALPRLPTRLSQQVRNILTYFENVHGHNMSVVICRQGVDGSELEFANLLTEDQNNDALSYGDYLMVTHREIMEEQNGTGAKEQSTVQQWTSAITPWSS